MPSRGQMSPAVPMSWALRSSASEEPSFPPRPPLQMLVYLPQSLLSWRLIYFDMVTGRTSMEERDSSSQAPAATCLRARDSSWRGYPPLHGQIVPPTIVRSGQPIFLGE